MDFNLDTFTLEELKEIYREVGKRIKVLSYKAQMDAACKFHIGDIVSFTNKDGEEQESIVTTIKPSLIKVMTLKDKISWKISPSMLTLVSKGTAQDLFKFMGLGMTEKVDKMSLPEKKKG